LSAVQQRSLSLENAMSLWDELWPLAAEDLARFRKVD